MPIVLAGATSGSTTVQATDAVTATLTLPSSTGTLISTATTGQAISPLALPAGSVIQTVTASGTSSTVTSSATFVSTGFSASITPKSSSSKIIIMILGSFTNLLSSTGQSVLTIYRNSTNIGNGNNGLAFCYSATAGQMAPNIGTTDLPATTSSTSYTLYIRNAYSGNVDWNGNNVLSTMVLMEVAV